MRSSIPKVMGILMIIFASLGVIFGLLGVAANGVKGVPAELKDIGEFKTYASMSLIFGVIGLAISALHLFAGIRAVGYKANAPKLATMYGAIGIAVTLANAIVVLAWMKP